MSRYSVVITHFAALQQQSQDSLISSHQGDRPDRICRSTGWIVFYTLRAGAKYTSWVPDIMMVSDYVHLLRDPQVENEYNSGRGDGDDDHNWIML